MPKGRWKLGADGLFPPEAKEAVVDFAKRYGAGYVTIARELDLPKSTVQWWLKEAKQRGDLPQKSLSLNAQLEIYRKENARLREERDALKAVLEMYARGDRG